MRRGEKANEFRLRLNWTNQQTAKSSLPVFRIWPKQKFGQKVKFPSIKVKNYINNELVLLSHQQHERGSVVAAAAYLQLARLHFLLLAIKHYCTPIYICHIPC